MSRGERHNHHAPAPRLHFTRPHDRVLGVITALHDDVGTEMIDELERRILREGNDEVDTLECREDISALGFRSDWTRRPFQAANRRVGVHADHEGIAGSARRCQQVDVAWMKKIEDTIGEDNPALSLSPPLLRLRPRRDFSGRIPRRQSRLLTDGWKWITFSFLKGSRMTSS